MNIFGSFIEIFQVHAHALTTSRLFSSRRCRHVYAGHCNFATFQHLQRRYTTTLNTLSVRIDHSTDKLNQLYENKNDKLLRLPWLIFGDVASLRF